MKALSLSLAGVAAAREFDHGRSGWDVSLGMVSNHEVNSDSGLYRKICNVYLSGQGQPPIMIAKTFRIYWRKNHV